MADIIKCPICGSENPQGQQFCGVCQSALTNDANSIQPGQAPTRKQTAELEPILPQWLREARDAARQNDSYSEEEPLPQSDKNKPASGDLLAGLQSQSGDDDEEEVPDWLANITGAQPKPKAEPTETTGARWVEIGGKNDFPQDEPEESSEGLPSWLAGLQSPESQPEQDELTGWQSIPAEPQQPAPIELPAEDTPDWLRQMAMDAESKPAVSETPSESAELPLDAPDWLSSLGNADTQTSSGDFSSLFESTPAESEAQPLPPLETPEWLKPPSELENVKQDTTPKWLRQEPASTPAEPETPAWLASEDTIHYSNETEQPAQDEMIVDLPDWLKAAAPESSIFSARNEEVTRPPEPSAAETPDWIKNFQQAADVSASQPEEPVSETGEVSPFENAPAFTPDFSSESSDLFAEMPDWLSNAVEPTSSANVSPSSAPTPITNEDALAPSDLPTWVQAMRPVEPGGIPQALYSSDQTLESRGALAGLQGVLPAAPGFTPTSKPKSYSIKLQTSDEQMAHAEILEQILAAEASPVPIESLPSLGASRGLRWFLAILFTLVALVTLSMRTQVFRLPFAAPNQVREAQAVVKSIPENSPLLVVFDYEPSRAGEMEAISAPLFDMLNNPRLTFLATNETGATLAEHFAAGSLSGSTYSNLGYLSGGQLGIRAFVQDPTRIAPVDIHSQPAWISTTLQGVTAINQFAAIILVTDNAEAARIWVEQTQGIRSVTPIPFIVVSSAQAAPMIEPYYESGQVSGVVPGLYGGALFEQYNAGLPGTARIYWDAYSIGMLLAVVLLLGGGLWNFVLGLRERSAVKGAE